MNMNPEQNNGNLPDKNKKRQLKYRRTAENTSGAKKYVSDNTRVVPTVKNSIPRHDYSSGINQNAVKNRQNQIRQYDIGGDLDIFVKKPVQQIDWQQNPQNTLRPRQQLQNQQLQNQQLQKPPQTQQPPLNQRKNTQNINGTMNSGNIDRVNKLPPSGQATRSQARPANSAARRVDPNGQKPLGINDRQAPPKHDQTQYTNPNQVNSNQARQHMNNNIVNNERPVVRKKFQNVNADLGSEINKSKYKKNISNNAYGRKNVVKHQNPPRRKSKYNKNTDRDEYKKTPVMLSNVIKAIIYIVFILVISLIASINIINIANDVFAFVKSNMTMDISVSEYDDTESIADRLYDYGVIKYPEIFKIYAKLRSYSDKYISGTYTISPSMNYDQLIFEFKGINVVREEISLTIREGWTVNEIINMFVSKGIGKREKFIDVIQNGDFDHYWFVKELVDLPASRPYRLEGYLFPDTYYFFTDSSEKDVIEKMLANFDEKFPEEYRRRAEELGYTTDQIITLASMIQAESRNINEYGKIASVFYNRLKYPGAGTQGYLNCDAAIQYALPERETDDSKIDTSIDSLYNTYKYKGLPPGPIGNPSLNAISFALEPDETNLFYFVSYSGGDTLFAESLEEHNKNIAIVRGYK